MAKKVKVVAVVLAVGAMNIIDGNACYITTTPDCSVYMKPKYNSCESGGIYSVVPAGGLPVDKCTDSSFGALGCQNEPPTNCSFSVTLTTCAGVVSAATFTNSITPTEDNGKGPCP
jgi:hypothetical protein